MKLMRRDGVLYFSKQNPLDAKAFTAAVISKFRKEDEKARWLILLNLTEEHVKLTPLLVLSRVTTMTSLEMLTKTYR